MEVMTKERTLLSPRPVKGYHSLACDYTGETLVDSSDDEIVSNPKSSIRMWTLEIFQMSTTLGTSAQGA
jgi:hypothetical protein